MDLIISKSKDKEKLESNISYIRASLMQTYINKLNISNKDKIRVKESVINILAKT